MNEMERVATTPERLQEAMTAAGKKQIDLAHETGLSHSTISRYLSGAVEPRQAAIIKLAKALNVSEWWLYGYKVPMVRTPEAKKNDAMVGVVSKMRSDPDFFEVVTQLAELPAGEYDSIKLLISSLRNK
jgi:transcriptional regulator with XRE-family HTH domain